MSEGSNQNTINPKYKVRDLSFDAIFGNKAGHLKKSVKNNYEHFEKYLDSAINIAQKKEEVTANYKKVNKNKEYEIERWYLIKIDFKMIIGPKTTITNDEGDIRSSIKFGLEVKDINLEKVTISGEEINFIRVDDQTVLISEKSDNIIINDSTEIIPIVEVYNTDQITYQGQTIPCRNGKVSIDKFEGDIAYDFRYPEIQYHLSKPGNMSGKEELTITLDDDPSNELSIYDVFFSEDVSSIYFKDKPKEEFKIKSKIKEYGQLVIHVPPKSNIANEGKISIKNNIYQLKSQKKALEVLINRPSKNHKPLLTISDDVNFGGLDNFNDVYNLWLDYKVLTDNSKKGNILQQTFVEKALQTPDFMILEGPPGSGKTTAILEFIYQATSIGKKVLLVASTHVAVDNVLEKMIKHKEKDRFNKVINPVRVGEELNVYVEEVKPFTYTNIMDQIPVEYRKIVINSFNLVCGTTIGIQQFPLLKDEIYSNSYTKGIEPMFDYLIIDEASKTTFSEFLVPAVFAKKWVIVGDVKQLAPYVEKNDLVPTLIQSEPLNNKDIRDALYYLKMSKTKKDMINKVFIMSGTSIQYIDRFANNEKIIAITDKKLTKIAKISSKDILGKGINLALLYVPGFIVIAEETLLKVALPYLNPLYKVISKDINIAHPEYFNTYGILHHRHSNLQQLLKSDNEEYSKKLEDELLWRLIRMYELTNNKDTVKIKKYESYIESFKEFLSEGDADKFDTVISTISEIALPSIITLLQNGLKKRSNSTKKSILTQGFSDQDKKHRFVSLEYQYRMHSDISDIPRTYIYDNKALKDDQSTNGVFKYINKKPRFELRNVTSDNVNNNMNKDEVNAVMSELNDFIKFVKDDGKTYEIAILSFYNGQVYQFRRELKKRFNSQSNFNFKEHNVRVTLNSVDKFQGQEADIVYLSMVQNFKVGFLDSVNRMNVAITRAKHKVILFGNINFFKNQKDSELLRQVFSYQHSSEMC